MIFIWRFGLIALSIYIITPILVPTVDTTTAFEKSVALYDEPYRDKSITNMLL